jgi:hypothetical protein
MENINENVTAEETEESFDTEEGLTTSENIKDILKSLNIDPMSLSEDVMAFLAEHAAIMGASATIALLLRNQDLSGLKGFGKICAGVGIVGLAGAAGAAAGGHMKKKIHNIFGFFREIKDMLTPDYSK